MTPATYATPTQLRIHHDRHDRLIRMGISDRPAPLAIAPPELRQEPPKPVPAPVAAPKPAPAPVEAVPTPIRWQAIVMEVCRKHGITRALLLGTNRRHPVVLARHEIFYRLHMERGMGLAQIGRMLGGFDHTTVRNGVMKHIERQTAPARTQPQPRNSTWTPERRRRAETMRADGATLEAIASALNLSREGVGSALRRWKAETEFKRIQAAGLRRAA